MKKYKVLALLFVCIMVFCSGCGKDPKKEIIGYWMRGDGYAISFVDESTCSFSKNSIETYTIYDENHLQVVDSDTGSVSEFIFEIEGDTLKLRLPEEDIYTEFTKDEAEQKKIMEEVRKWEEIAIEEGMLQEQMDSISSEIDRIQEAIDKNERVIQSNKDYIKDWKEAIDEEYVICEESISDGWERSICENERDNSIASHNRQIEFCEARIAECQVENAEYQKQIDAHVEEINRLQQEMDSLFEE